MSNLQAAVLVVLLAIAGTTGAGAASPAKARVGAYRAGQQNGCTFIYDDAAFAFGIGWLNQDKYFINYPEYMGVITRAETCAPDSSIMRAEWKSGTTKISLVWGKSGDNSIIGRLSSDGPALVTIEALAPWKTFTTAYKAGKDEITGSSGPTDKPALAWKLKASRPADAVSMPAPERDAPERVLLPYNLAPDKPVYFAAGTGALPSLEGIDARLAKAEKAYLSRRPAASGDWKDFIEPIVNVLNNSKVYGWENKMVAHVVTRAWCSPDGQVLFEWDSFFNGLLSCLDDPEGAKATIRAILATQQPNGLLPSMNGPGSSSVDRSQPPVGAMCVWKMHQRRPDKAFLAEVYPKLVKWHQWWFAPRPSNGLPYRDGNQNGLLEWGSQTGGLQEAKWESGLDDSPMYDEMVMDPKACTMKLDDVGLSAMWAMDAQFLSLIADELGKPKEAAKFRDEQKAMAERINKLMWNPELGMYCNRYWEPTKQYVPVEPEFLSTTDGKQGLAGEYFTGKEFDILVRTETDPNVMFSWKQAPVAVTKASPSYSVRWTGKIRPSATGEHRFLVVAWDAVRLKVNGQTLIDEWRGRWWSRTQSLPIQLEASKEYDISLEHFRGDGGGELNLLWQGPSAGTEPQVLSPSLSPTSFYPLLAGIATRERAEQMLKVLTDPAKFWGEYVVPSISRDDVSFPKEHYWRGKIWAPTNYLVYQGLKDYAPDDLRMQFARKSVDLFMRNWTNEGTCRENFWTDGRGGSIPQYTWGSLMCLIGLEEICDILPDGSLRLNGKWPATISVDRFPIHGQLYSVQTKPGTAVLRKSGREVLKATGAPVTGTVKK